MKALVFERFGGPEVLELKEVPDPVPVAGEALIRTRAIGLNFADVYRRKGTYHLVGTPPFIAGYEAAGEVVAVSGDSSLKPGDRVAFADSPFANAELVAVPIEKLIRLPNDIGFDLAAALLLQGLTAHYLVRDSHSVKAGERVLIHAAAGGVGLLLVQMAKRLGATVIGLTSSVDKTQAVRDSGADEVLPSDSDWVSAVKGADVAYDSIGSTLMQSFDAVRTGGHVVFYGMAGGEPPLVNPRMLMDTSKTLTGGDLWNMLTSHEERLCRSEELFAWVRSGALKVTISARFPLAEGGKAHAFLESRASSGKVLLIP